MADYAISNVPRRVVYAASGTGPYAFTFEILAASDIAVYKGDTLLTLTTDYSVTINANGTGSITLVATAGTSNITIVGSKTIARTTDFTTGGDFFANTLNDELDAQTIFIQQVAETAERGLKAPVTDPTDINMTLPRKADRAGKYLAFDANGDPKPGDTAVEVAAIAVIADEIVTVAGISTEVVAVAGNEADINTVAGSISNVNSVGNNISNVNATATNIANVNAVGADLLEGVSEINTVATSIADVNTVGTNIASVTSVAGNATNINAVAGNNTNISTVAGISANVTTVAGIAANVTTVAGISSNVTTVATDIANINTVASDLNEPVSEINTVATNITNVNAVGTDISNVNTCATNMAAIIDAPNQAAAAAASAAAAAASYDNFDDRYLGVKTANPTLDNDGNALVSGALYFNSGAVTPADKGMYVYDGAVWIPASAASSAIMITYKYTATAGQTTFSGSDDNALTLAYTAGSIIVTLNGVVLEVPSEATASNGSSVVLATGASAGDELNVYAFATFDIANVYTKAETDAFAVKLTGAQTVAGVKTFSNDLIATGNVGIGTSSPSTKLTVAGSTQIQTGTFPTSGNGLELTFTAANIAYIQGYDRGTNTWRTVDFGGATLQFETAGTERMRIDSAGYVAFGTTSTTPTGSNNSVILRPGAASYFSLASQNCASFNRYTTTGIVVNIDYAGSTVGNISTNGSNCTFNSTSDYRLKEDIAPMTGALKKVFALKPVTYKWKQNQQAGEGFIAHELAEVCPEAVTGKKDEVNDEGKPVYQSIDQSFLIATLTAAIQEQQALITNLTTRLTALENK